MALGTSELAKRRLVATLHRLSQESAWYKYFRPIDVVDNFPEEWKVNYTGIGPIGPGGYRNSAVSRRINDILESMVDGTSSAKSMLLLSENCGSRVYRTNLQRSQDIEEFLEGVTCLLSSERDKQ